MLRSVMKTLGMIPDPNEPVVIQPLKTKTAETASPPKVGELTIKQWEDSAGSYHTEVFDEKGQELATWYALGEVGARWHARRANRFARRWLKQRELGETADGWEITGDSRQPKRREFKVTR